MKATISNPKRAGTNYGSEKETIDRKNVIAVKDGVPVECVTARWYMSHSRSANVVYCTVWVDNVCSGSGRATGGGYHKKSTALGEALRSAGVQLDENIDGAGDRAVTAALEACAVCLGFQPPFLIV